MPLRKSTMGLNLGAVQAPPPNQAPERFAAPNALAKVPHRYARSLQVAHLRGGSALRVPSVDPVSQHVIKERLPEVRYKTIARPTDNLILLVAALDYHQRDPDLLPRLLAADEVVEEVRVIF